MNCNIFMFLGNVFLSDELLIYLMFLGNELSDELLTYLMTVLFKFLFIKLFTVGILPSVTLWNVGKM